MSECDFDTGNICMETDPCQHNCTFDGKTKRLNGLEIATMYWDWLGASDKEHFKRYRSKPNSVEIDRNCNESEPCVHVCIIDGVEKELTGDTIVNDYWEWLSPEERRHFQKFRTEE